jgi:hypothetical protein
MQTGDRTNALLASLVAKEGLRILDLPYTNAFDRIFAAFKGANSIDVNQHELWELLLQLDAATDAAEGAMSRTESTHQPVPATPTVSQRPSQSSTTFPISLFSDRVAQSQQPWTVTREPEPQSAVEHRRQRILAGIANRTFATVEQKVAYILDRYPETRNSDIRLCIRYWEFHQPAQLLQRGSPQLEVLFDLDKWTTIVRERALLQNDLQLFRASDEAALSRLLGQHSFHEYLAARRGVHPEIRFYLDETGNEGDKRYTGVAGICVMNWQQYEMHHAAIAEFRRALQWAGTIHFSDTGQDGFDRAVRLLSQLQARRSGLLFVGYALPSQGRTHPDMLSLFVQLIVDSLKQMRANGCLDEARSLRVIKEADAGFDAIYLDAMKRYLADLTALELPELVVVESIEPVPKGSAVVFLECADLIAGGMQRRALSKGSTARDRLAEAVANVTGFETPEDGGVVFKCFPANK